jgi:hypothetical protein
MSNRSRFLVLLILLINLLSGGYVYYRLWGPKRPPRPEPPGVTARAPQAPSEPTSAPALEPAPGAEAPPAPVPEAAVAPATPVATLTDTQQTVKLKRAAESEWQDAGQNTPLFDNDAVRTFENARARITFGADDTLDIEQNTLLIISAPRQHAVSGEIALSVLPGEVADQVAARPAPERNQALESESAGRQVTLRPVRPQGGKEQKTRVSVRALPDQSAGVEAVSGQAEIVDPKGKTVTLKEKMVTHVAPGGAVSSPRLPLAAPELLAPGDGASFTFQAKVPRVELRWKAVERASEYRLVVARDERFRTVFADERVRGNTSFTIGNLPAGTYHWRVCALDAEGFTGRYSAARSMHAVYDDLPPTLTILSPPDMSVVPQPNVDLKGRTEPGARLKVNGQKVAVAKDGSFTLAVALKEGVNLFTVEATDPAGNTAYGKRVLTYKGGKRAAWPASQGR